MHAAKIRNLQGCLSIWSRGGFFLVKAIPKKTYITQLPPLSKRRLIIRIYAALVDESDHWYNDDITTAWVGSKIRKFLR